MDKNKEELIELILDRLILLEKFDKNIKKVFNIDTFDGCSVADKVSDIGFIGIPLLLEVEPDDFLNDLLYGCITEEITKKQYLKSLEKYLKEIK